MKEITPYNITAQQLNSLSFEEAIILFYKYPKYCSKHFQITPENSFKDLHTAQRKDPKRLEEVTRNFFNYTDKEKLDLLKANSTVFCKIVEPYYHKKLSKELGSMSTEEKNYIKKLYPKIYETAEINYNIKQISKSITDLKPGEILQQMPDYLPKGSQEQYAKHCIESNLHEEIKKYFPLLHSYYTEYYKAAYLDKSQRVSEQFEDIILNYNSAMIFFSNKGFEFKKNYIIENKINMAVYLSFYKELSKKVDTQMDKFFVESLLKMLKGREIFSILGQLNEFFAKNPKFINYMYEIDLLEAKRVFSTPVAMSRDMKSTTEFTINYIQSLFNLGFTIEDEELLYQPIKSNTANYIKYVPLEEMLFVRQKYKSLFKLNLERIENQEIFAAGIYNSLGQAEKDLQGLAYLNEKMCRYILQNINIGDSVRVALEKKILDFGIKDGHETIRFKI